MTGMVSLDVYWKYCLTVDDSKIEGGSPALANLLKEKNIFSAPRYIVKPAFMCQVFQEKNTLGDSQFPFNLAREGAVDYVMDNYPLTAKALHDVLVLPWKVASLRSRTCASLISSLGSTSRISLAIGLLMRV